MDDGVSHELALASLTCTAPTDPAKNPALVHLASRGTGGSRRSALWCLEVVCAEALPGSGLHTFPWCSLRWEHISALRTRFSERYAPGTANRLISAVRSVLFAAWRLRLLSLEEVERACDVPRVEGSRLPPGRSLPQGELAALFAAANADRPRRGRRDAAMLALLFGAGLRRSEVCTIDVPAGIEREGNRWAVKLIGKNNKERRVPLPRRSAAALCVYLAVRGEEPGPLFFGRKGRRLSDGSVWQILESLVKRAGIEAASPHDLRRTYISELLDAGADLVVVQKLAGHASPSTTANYDRRGKRALERAAELLAVPYERDAQTANAPAPTREPIEGARSRAVRPGGGRRG